MYPLERRLLNDGFCVLSFNLGTLNTRDIRRSAFLIHRKIERVLAQTSWEEIDIVGHSMGGLIGLYYVKKLGGHARVRKLVMMGTPIRGTWSALLGVASLGLYSTSSWQLLPRSRFLDELARGPVPHGVELYTIAAARDWVCPPASTRMGGAKATTVPLGHSSLVVSDEVYQRLRTILRSGETPSALMEAGTVDPKSSELEVHEVTDDVSSRPVRGSRIKVVPTHHDRAPSETSLDSLSDVGTSDGSNHSSRRIDSDSGSSDR